MSDQKEYICLDCKSTVEHGQIKMHPDYEGLGAVEVWGYSCPDCLGELKEKDYADIED